MKKKLLIFSLLIFICTGCTNMEIVDTTYTYNYAYISLPNGACIEGKVDSWKDFDDSDQIQIKINGITYLTDTTRAVLIYRKD